MKKIIIGQLLVLFLGTFSVFSKNTTFHNQSFFENNNLLKIEQPFWKVSVTEVMRHNNSDSLKTKVKDIKEKKYAIHPYWIKMMQDTNANYFETEKAFNAYWKNREKPEDENEKFEASHKKNSNQKKIPYSFEYKKFKKWELFVKPYVQNDGHILYPYQQLQLIKQSRKQS